MLKKHLLLFPAGVLLVGSLWAGNLFQKHSTPEANLTDKIKVCQRVDPSQKLQCWEELLDDTLNTQGLDSAFSVLDSLYRTEPQFANSCHSFAHLLGQKAYQILNSGKELALNDKSTYCGYGFYHGLMDELLKKDLNSAKGFCQRVGKTYPTSIVDACYHGLGHGAFSSSAPKFVGNAQSILNASLQICRQATDDQTTYSRCASGVFMELGTDLSSNQYRLSVNPSDPLSICRVQNQDVALDCYTQLNGVIYSLSGGDFLKGAKIIEDIGDDYFSQEAIETYASTYLNISLPSHSTDIQNCRLLQDRLRLSCIKGLALGFMLKATPGEEYKEAVKFCKLNLLNEEEKQACFGLILRQSSLTYSKEINGQVCKLIDNRYWGQYCKEG